jgi:pantoate--beta-alanine ligase
MQILKDAQEFHALCLEWRAQGRRLALVPTMGAYHAGHISLMHAAKADGATVLVSLFVNPAQFGPDEDLAAYPRNPERDAEIAGAAGVEALFMPDPQNLYEADHAVWVDAPALARKLCGLSRPEHFRGVCTVVLKLLLLSQAHHAFFGEKDWQQLAIIRRVVRDLNVPVAIRACPTVREADGLALSSRNAYLTPVERAQAPQIQAGLRQARDLARRGERAANVLCAAVREHWARHLPLGREEYLSLVHPHSLEDVETIGAAALMACAVRLGKARLIDNILLPQEAL